jgi:hypothetical protein
MNHPVLVSFLIWKVINMSLQDDLVLAPLINTYDSIEGSSIFY